VQIYDEIPNVLGIIPARGGSKGIRNKNLIRINDSSLIERAAYDCSACERITHIAVSSDDARILAESPEGVIQIDRPPQFATDTSPIDDTFNHALSFLENHGVDIEIIVWIQPNVPIREEGIIDQVLDRLLRKSDVTGVATCTLLDSRLYWTKVIDDNGGLQPLISDIQDCRRQDLNQLVLLDGAVTAFFVKNLEQRKSGIHTYLGDRPIGIPQAKKYIPSNWITK
jgi:CMP-N,N'-diacetyllegionaminic acid synthase